MKKYKIAVVTGSRADYGLLCWLMRDIQNDAELELQVIVTGMHLSPEFGLSYQFIEQDGFVIDYKIESQLSSDTAVGLTKSVGLGVIGFADAYAQLKPDFVVLLGDRFEILAAATAALFAKIPTAHLYGGEETRGAFDESVRHAISKMSHLHFVSAELYRQRVIQLGEQPERVFNYGVSGLDHLSKTQLLSRDELQDKLKFQFGSTNLLVTYHPVTLQNVSTDWLVNELLIALSAFPEANIIFTKSNADTDGRKINQLIDAYVAQHPQRAIAFTNLGTLNYLSMLKQVDIMIGNSSSGIVEVPYMKKPTVNIGSRQEGRLRAASIIDCDESHTAIVAAIQKGLAMRKKLQESDVRSPYGNGDGDVSGKIKAQIKKHCMQNMSLIKPFYQVTETV